jgi:hypothetical protein
MKKLATALILCWPSYPAQLSVPATVRKTKGRLGKARYGRLVGR